jgi:hypothetical protein
MLMFFRNVDCLSMNYRQLYPRRHVILHYHRYEILKSNDLVMYIVISTNLQETHRNVWQILLEYIKANILYFSILLNSFNTEYLFFCEAETCRRLMEYKKWMCYIEMDKRTRIQELLMPWRYSGICEGLYFSVTECYRCAVVQKFVRGCQ